MRFKWMAGAMAVLVFGVSGLAAQRDGAAPAMDHSARRVLDDAGTGNRWLLRRDPAHPGGPGQLVEVEGGAAGDRAVSLFPVKPAVLVIHDGDRVMVEERTTFAQGRLEAVAQASAAIGGELTVRLVSGGKILHAVAEGPGRARLEAQP